MKRLPLPATKGNLLKLREEYAQAAEALTFLEEKRDLLVGELLRMQSQARSRRQEAEQVLARVYSAVKEGLLSLGSAQVSRLAPAATPEAFVTLQERIFLGMPMPVLRYHPFTGRPAASLQDTMAALDSVPHLMNEALSRISALAEVEAVLGKLAQELNRTIRRTNALSYEILPTFRETRHYLEDSLEEREREALFHLKRLKARRVRGPS
jgi:V/A-type H+-transporting ATPase subunit D